MMMEEASMTLIAAEIFDILVKLDVVDNCTTLEEWMDFFYKVREYEMKYRRTTCDSRVERYEVQG